MAHGDCSRLHHAGRLDAVTVGGAARSNGEWKCPALLVSDSEGHYFIPSLFTPLFTQRAHVPLGHQGSFASALTPGAMSLAYEFLVKQAVASAPQSDGPKNSSQLCHMIAESARDTSGRPGLLTFSRSCKQ